MCWEQDYIIASQQVLIVDATTQVRLQQYFSTTTTSSKEMQVFGQVNLMRYSRAIVKKLLKCSPE
jgi:hypothetical protein